jgi:hypothetical protein
MRTTGMRSERTGIKGGAVASCVSENTRGRNGTRRRLFALCAAAGLVWVAAGSEVSGITVDGSIADWSAANIYSDPLGDNQGQGAMLQTDMTRWGAVVKGNTFYGFIEMSEPISAFNGPTGHTGNSYWWFEIDADDVASTFVNGRYVAGCAADIGPEVGIDTDLDEVPRFDFWGAEDDMGQLGNPVSSGAIGIAGRIIEVSFLVSELAAEVYTYPDHVVSGPTWTVAAVVETSGGLGWEYDQWGNDVSDEIATIANPEPPIPGDANYDDHVDDEDASILGANWLLQSGATWEMGDFNHDFKVNDKDAAIMAAHWTGSEGNGGSVPEPGAVVLLVSAAMALWFRRRR